MRAIFSILGLLAVVAVVGVLAKKQLTSAGSTAAAPAAATGGVVVPTGTPKQQLDQVKQSLDVAAQPRAIPDETK